MWIVIIHADKKLAFEITGEETLRDIKRVLQMVYNFPKQFSFHFQSRNLQEYQGTIGELLEERNDSNCLIEFRVSNISSDQEHKGPVGPVAQDKDISIGRYFKKEDPLSPSSVTQSLKTSKSSKAPSLKGK